MITPDDVLEYWFGNLASADEVPSTVSRWFKGGPEFLKQPGSSF